MTFWFGPVKSTYQWIILHCFVTHDKKRVRGFFFYFHICWFHTRKALRANLQPQASCKRWKWTPKEEAVGSYESQRNSYTTTREKILNMLFVIAKYPVHLILQPQGWRGELLPIVVIYLVNEIYLFYFAVALLSLQVSRNSTVAAAFIFSYSRQNLVFLLLLSSAGWILRGQPRVTLQWHL